MCAIICTNAARQVPINYILCFLFTAGMGTSVAFFTIPYPPTTVFNAALATALVVVALTIYAMTTTADISIFYGLIFIFYFAWLPICVICFAVNVYWLNTVIILIVIILYGLYLIVDTMQICNAGKSYGGHAVDFDDYILGAMILYLDIIMIFMYVLALFGGGGGGD